MKANEFKREYLKVYHILVNGIGGSNWLEILDEDQKRKPKNILLRFRPRGDSFCHIDVELAGSGLSYITMVGKEWTDTTAFKFTTGEDALERLLMFMLRLS